MYGIIKHCSDLAPAEGQDIILTNADIFSIAYLETNPMIFESNYNSFHVKKNISNVFACMIFAIWFRSQCFVIGKSQDIDLWDIDLHSSWVDVVSLTWLDFKPNMGKELRVQLIVEWNYLSIAKLIWNDRWSLGK